MRTCPVCRITMTAAEGPLWCQYQRCPETQQRGPSQFQEKRFGMDEEGREEARRQFSGSRDRQ